MDLGQKTVQWVHGLPLKSCARADDETDGGQWWAKVHQVYLTARGMPVRCSEMGPWKGGARGGVITVAVASVRSLFAVGDNMLCSVCLCHDAYVHMATIAL